MHRKQHFNIIRGMSLCHHYAPEDYVHDQDMFKTMIQFPNHERHSRFVMLAKIRDNKTITVISALIRQARKLPAELYRTLTWDRGAEMTSHTRFTIATDIQIYFCDPQSPWQRGSNENTNRLLRLILPTNSGHRTMQRRVRDWKLQYGAEQEVMFRQRHQPVCVACRTLPN